MQVVNLKNFKPNNMDKESTYLLQLIDCNCNDCMFMVRDFEKLKKFNHLHTGQEKSGHRVQYGNCEKLIKPVSFIPNTCQIETQQCFKHRK